MSRKSPPPDPERQILQKIAQALVQWSPLGGSGWLLAHFLWQQDWVQAAITFPMTAVSVVWAAYTESFIARLREIFSDRGRQDADSLMSGVGKVDQALRWQISGYEDKYLRCQANACRDFVIEGFRKNEGIFTPMLTEVFVPLELDNEFGHGIDGSAIPADFSADNPEVLEKLREKEGMSIWDFLHQVKRIPAYRRTAILAWGGYGKTTLLRNLTFRYASNPGKVRRQYKVPRLIPFLLYLRKWRDVLAQDDAPSLAKLLTEQYIPELPEGQRLKLPPNWADNLLRRGEGLVMIDGFDEVAETQRQAVSQWINTQMTEYPRSVFILTSRPAGYDHYEADKLSTTLRVRRFNDDQRDQFIQRWYHCQERYARGGRDTPDVKKTADDAAEQLIAQINQREELRAMAQNPLMLSMIAAFHRFYPGGTLPQKRTMLYQDICQMQLEDRPRAKRIEMLLLCKDSQKVLQGIALEMVQRNCTTLPQTDMIALAKTYLEQVTDEVVCPEMFLDQIVKVSELLVEREADEYEFAHLSFQGYLAATEINRRGLETLLVENWDKAWWRETILLYAIQMKDPTRLIGAACGLGPEATELAYACYRENPRWVAQETLDAIQELVYQELENLLREGDWKNADLQTWRVMVQVCKKDFPNLLSSKELLNFPCEDLHRINDLWLKYSDGHFGFSVQKEMYLYCGGILDGKHHQEAWNKFCEKNGWKEEGDYIFTKKKDDDSSILGLEAFDYSLDASMGHLPSWSGFLIGVSGGLWSGEWGLDIFSRIETCRL
ncbi:MAG: GUN4 domain-containing protein [Cyanobacteria bacterium P01_G01_bin.54]